MIRGAASEALVPVPIIAGALLSGGRAGGARGPTIGKAAGPGRIPEFVLVARRGAATVVIIIPFIAVAASRRGRRGLARNTAPLIRMPVPTRTVVGASLLVRRGRRRRKSTVWKATIPLIIPELIFSATVLRIGSSDGSNEGG
jgi:hypothetical protein